jgi:hypothetical protein
VAEATTGGRGVVWLILLLIPAACESPVSSERTGPLVDLARLAMITSDTIPCPLGFPGSVCLSMDEFPIEDYMAELQDALPEVFDDKCNEALIALGENPIFRFVPPPNAPGAATIGGGWVGVRYDSSHFNPDRSATPYLLETLMHEGLHLAGYRHEDLGGYAAFETFALECVSGAYNR